MLYLTREQVREVDRRAVERYGIPGIVLMENASIGAARVALAMLRRERARHALVLCGGGNNGGDGLAVARHLHNRGINVVIATTVDPLTYKGDAGTNCAIVRAMHLRIDGAEPEMIRAWKKGIIIDAIFGTGLSSEPRWDFSPLVDAVAASGVPVLAIDVPSALDCNTGEPLGSAIAATRTVTFVARKAGFTNPASRRYTGQVTVAPIGVPQELISEVATPLHIHVDPPESPR